MRTVIMTDNAPKAIGPYSQAMKSGRLLFTSGQIPIDPSTGGLVQGEIGEQTHRVMKHLEAILQAGGASFDSVVKTSVFLTDMRDFQDFNKAYAGYFRNAAPPRSTVQVAALPLNARIEIDMIAVVE